MCKSRYLAFAPRKKVSCKKKRAPSRLYFTAFPHLLPGCLTPPSSHQDDAVGESDRRPPVHGLPSAPARRRGTAPPVQARGGPARPRPAARPAARRPGALQGASAGANPDAGDVRSRRSRGREAGDVSTRAWWLLDLPAVSVPALSLLELDLLAVPARGRWCRGD